jgi:hypothetical protein
MPAVYQEGDRVRSLTGLCQFFNTHECHTQHTSSGVCTTDAYLALLAAVSVHAKAQHSGTADNEQGCAHTTSTYYVSNQRHMQK